MTTSQDRRAIIRRGIDFENCPRYDKHELTEEQIIEIAKKAVVLARDEFYKDVGQSVTSKVFIVIGMAFIAGVTWLTSHGYLK